MKKRNEFNTNFANFTELLKTVNFLENLQQLIKMNSSPQTWKTLFTVLMNAVHKITFRLLSAKE